MSPRVSVVMGVFNDATCVPAAIDSIRAQSLTGWELVIVDDGSTDETAEVLDRCAADDARIRLSAAELTHVGDRGAGRGNGLDGADRRRARLRLRAAARKQHQHHAQPKGHAQQKEHDATHFP